MLSMTNYIYHIKINRKISLLIISECSTQSVCNAGISKYLKIDRRMLIWQHFNDMRTSKSEIWRCHNWYDRKLRCNNYVLFLSNGMSPNKFEVYNEAFSIPFNEITIYDSRIGCARVCSVRIRYNVQTQRNSTDLSPTGMAERFSMLPI